jgi:AcrR family transcriptional regulator
MISCVATADRRPGRPRDARVDEQIVEATLAEVAERGFGGATVESIASRAGVGKATIYRRWPNREALLHFVALRVSDVVDPPDTGDLRKDLISIFEPLARELYQGGAGALMPDLVAEAARDPKIRQMVRGLALERRSAAVTALERAKARGELRPRVDIDTAVDLIAGSFLYRFLLLGEELHERFVIAAVDHALHGVLR